MNPVLSDISCYRLANCKDHKLITTMYQFLPTQLLTSITKENLLLTSSSLMSDLQRWQALVLS